MKKLTKQEFEIQVERLLKGEISRKALAKELNTDINTLTRKILDLSNTNPSLYLKWVKKFPYRPKSTNINEEELAIGIINDGLQPTIERLGISKMTVTRKIRKLKGINPELYTLYRQRNDEMTDIERERFLLQVEKYSNGYKVVQRTDIEDKKREIEEELKNITELMNRDGIGIEEAARRMGFRYSVDLWRHCRYLERIVTEERAKAAAEQVKKDDKQVNFLEGLKCNVRIQPRPRGSSKKEADNIEKGEK